MITCERGAWSANDTASSATRHRSGLCTSPIAGRFNVLEQAFTVRAGPSIGILLGWERHSWTTDSLPRSLLLQKPIPPRWKKDLQHLLHQKKIHKNTQNVRVKA
mmetsp:Transcript_18123/g.41934  ORF Transcript_18123/g.41934 Transcript_18123/m.41934 type:complete len:104 (-) Transcript_18123:682-993(-)